VRYILPTPLASSQGESLLRRLRRWRDLPLALRLASLQLLHDFLDGALELVVGASVLARGVVVDYDVGIDAVAFDDPLLAVDGVGGELGFAQGAAVDEGDGAADADGAAPAAFADQLAEL
jgi:hypothetical protein